MGQSRALQRGLEAPASNPGATKPANWRRAIYRSKWRGPETVRREDVDEPSPTAAPNEPVRRQQENREFHDDPHHRPGRAQKATPVARMGRLLRRQRRIRVA